MKNSILTLFISILLSTLSYGQLFKKMLDRTADKITQRVEDKVVEGISTELANRAVRPLDNVYNEIFRTQYKETYGKDWDDEEFENDEERDKAMQAMFGNMFGSVELPEAYKFDKLIEFEVYDYGEKKPHQMTLFTSSTQGIFGMEQYEDGKKLMVYDFENDIMTIFDENENTAMAIPNVMSMAKAFQPMIEEEMQKDMEDVEVSEIKSKTILDCSSKGYKVKTDEEESEFYICTDAGISWSDSYGKFMKQLSPNFYEKNEMYQQFTDGMLMRAKTKRKKDKKESKWETTNIENKAHTIITSNYELTNTMGQ